MEGIKTKEKDCDLIFIQLNKYLWFVLCNRRLKKRGDIKEKFSGRMAILENFWKLCNNVRRIWVLLGFRANVGASRCIAHSEKKKKN